MNDGPTGSEAGASDETSFNEYQPGLRDACVTPADAVNDDDMVVTYESAMLILGIVFERQNAEKEAAEADLAWEETEEDARR